ncbi:MAG: PTS glucose transporter subunit IIA, partial [Longicatena sp.]
KGVAISLSEVKDEMFSNKALGDGVAIIPEIGELRAPADGVIKMVFETKHAIGMETTNGTELLFHVGIDTVELNGKCFEAHVTSGDHVKRGDLLLSFDIEEIKKLGYDVTTPVIVTNTTDYEVVHGEVGVLNEQSVLMKSERKIA